MNRPTDPAVTTDVGVLSTYWIERGKETESEMVVKEIFGAMAEEEFPTGDVKLYSGYWDPARPGTGVMFEHFTAAGAAAHARGPRMLEAGSKLPPLMARPWGRALLQPLYLFGLGEQPPGARTSSTDPMSDVAFCVELQGYFGKDVEMEKAFSEAFDAMGKEEFPTGDVKVFAIYRDPAQVSRYVLFEHFTKAGADGHGSGPRVAAAAAKFEPLTMIMARSALEPVIFAGAGEPITRVRS
jgi:quinol monooxygenase YgiN